MSPPTEVGKVSMRVTDGSVLLADRRLFLGDRRDLLEAIARLIPAHEVQAVITPNVDQTLNLERDPMLRRAYEEAVLRLADGAPLVALGRMLGGRGLHRLTGADLFVDVAKVARDRGWRIAVTGGAPEVATRAARRLGELYGADVTAVEFPSVSSIEDSGSLTVIKALTDAQPDLVFVCLGSPKQDTWVSYWRDALPPAVYVGAGAAVDFVAGTKRRAPRVVQAVGTEWLFRMLQEPRRLTKRYVVRGPHFLGVAARSLRGARTEKA